MTMFLPSSTGFSLCGFDLASASDMIKAHRLKSLLGSGKNRFPHPFSIPTFVEATQVKCFYKKYNLWKSRLPPRLSLRGFELGCVLLRPLQPSLCYKTR